MLPRQIWSF